ncbi:MAB_1171c family putative transporter [Nocardia vulneris]|uniref:MAB_1171c family putative transporter n=1 Tax=Nocardia vulneris TaxID=1141657 RepID=UPI0030D5550D
MNSAPPVFTTVVVVFVLAIICGRWWLVNETFTDRLINRALSWDIVAVFGYWLLAVLGYPDLGQRVFMAIGFLALSNTFGFIVLLDGARLETTWRRQRGYDAVAISVGLVVLVVAVGGEMDLFPPAAQGVYWDGSLWMAIDLAIAAIAVVLGRACIRELRVAASTTREKLTYWPLLAVGCYAGSASVYRTLHTLSGASPQDMGTAWVVGSFAALAMVAVLISMPLADALLARAGLDQAGRCCRRLHPLWRDLTTAVPEVVLPLDQTEQPGSSARLYRMTVEIRDALLHLKQFAPDPAVAEFADLGAYARDIAAAARLKLHGNPPAPQPRFVQFPVGDRSTELRTLLALSREWTTARTALAGGAAS